MKYILFAVGCFLIIFSVVLFVYILSNPFPAWASNKGTLWSHENNVIKHIESIAAHSLKYGIISLIADRVVIAYEKTRR